ncbi:hypothetical protein [Caulobacter sp. LARHSG274]
MVAPEKLANDYQSKAALSCHEWGEAAGAAPYGSVALRCDPPLSRKLRLTTVAAAGSHQAMNLTVPNLARALILAAATTVLGGCIDDATGKWIDPVTLSSAVGQGVVKSRSAAKPPLEWEALCRSGFTLERAQPAPAPDGLAISGGPATIALALKRTGATYAVLHIDATDGGWLAPLITEPGVYRVRRRGDPAYCDAQLDQVVSDWSRQGKAWKTAAGQCLAAERVGPYTALNLGPGSPMAPYFVRGVVEERMLGGDFKVEIYGEALVERATGREIVRRMNRASLTWRLPDADHIYWGERRSCGPGSKMGPFIGLEGQRLFAPI